MSAEAGPSQTRSTAFSRWRDSVADLTGLGLSDNQKSEAAKAEAERQKMANDWDRCEEWKQKLMTQSKSMKRACALLIYRSDCDVHVEAFGVGGL